MAKRQSFFSELKHRNVLRAVVLYIGAVWALAQGVSQLTPAIGLPDRATRWFLIACVIGFPFWVAFAWFYEFTPRGFKRESEVAEDAPARHSNARRLDFAIIGVLIVAVVLLGSGYFIHRNSPTMAAQTIPAKSIAVLPFENLSGDPNEKYFSDGITEEILNALAQIPDLKVTARTSAFKFNSKDEDPRKIGETLGVANVLEGSVQKAGDEVRINVRLVDTHTGYQRWSEKYDRKLTNIFAVEDDISNAVAGKLRVQLSGGGGQALVAQQAIDPHAHDFYLRGLTLLAARSMREATNAFQRAVKLDPGYAQAWGALAETEVLLPAYGLDSVAAALPRAQSAAQRALTLDPNTASAYVALGVVYSVRWQWAEADQAFQRALTLAPGDAEAVDQYAQFLYAVGQLEPALRAIEHAQELDPLSAVIGAIRASILGALHRYDAAAAQIERTLAAHPDFAVAHSIAVLLAVNHHRYAEAEAQIRLAAELKGTDPDAKALIERGIADPALRAAAVKSLETSPANADLRRDPIVYASFLTQLGEHDRALDVLEGNVASRNSDQSQLLWDPAFDPIRNDPRFEAVLEKMGLPYTLANGSAATGRD